MNNLANLVQYKSKYGDICQEIDSYYAQIVEKPRESNSSFSAKSSYKPKIKGSLKLKVNDEDKSVTNE